MKLELEVDYRQNEWQRCAFADLFCILTILGMRDSKSLMLNCHFKFIPIKFLTIYYPHSSTGIISFLRLGNASVVLNLFKESDFSFLNLPPGT